jgi:hypothetical protein
VRLVILPLLDARLRPSIHSTVRTSLLEGDSSMKSGHSIKRRKLLTAGATAAAATFLPRHVVGGAGNTPPSEKLNIAAVGLGGMGTGDVRNLSGENIVALCDVDHNALAKNAKLYPAAKLHSDFRKMNAATLRFTNADAANALIAPPYRAGWKL